MSYILFSIGLYLVLFSGPDRATIGNIFRKGQREATSIYQSIYVRMILLTLTFVLFLHICVDLLDAIKIFQDLTFFSVSDKSSATSWAGVVLTMDTGSGGVYRNDKELAIFGNIWMGH